MPERQSYINPYHSAVCILSQWFLNIVPNKELCECFRIMRISMRTHNCIITTWVTVTPKATEMQRVNV